jgi:hypothetical protein
MWAASDALLGLTRDRPIDALDISLMDWGLLAN